MIAVDILHLMLAVFVALFLWRYLQSKINQESTTGKAFAYVLH
jgi:hypothetical protein